MQQSQSSWARIIEAIDKPLGFYVLALLIMEGFLALVLTVSGLEADVKERGMWSGVGMFMLVVIIVSIIVWFRPTILTFTERGSLTQMGRASYGTNLQEMAESDLPSGRARPPGDP